MGGKKQKKWAKGGRDGAYYTMPLADIGPQLEEGLLTLQGAVFHYLWYFRYDGANGEILSSRKRSEIALVLGVKESSVRRAIEWLVKKGRIKKVAGGYKGASTVYELKPRDAWPLIKGSPQTGPSTKGKGSPQTEKRVTSEVPQQGPKGHLGGAPTKDVLKDKEKDAPSGPASAVAEPAGAKDDPAPGPVPMPDFSPRPEPEPGPGPKRAGVVEAAPERMAMFALVSELYESGAPVKREQVDEARRVLGDSTLLDELERRCG